MPAPVLSAETTFEAGVYRLRWTTASSNAVVRILVSANPVALPAAMKVLDQANTRGEALFREPLGPGVRPYFYIVPHGASGLRTATRVVPLEGASNFRDIGGYLAADGRHVKWGQIFRSNKLSDLTPRDYETINHLGIILVCDLRTGNERKKRPTTWRGKPPEFLASPKTLLDTDLETLMTGGSPSVAQAREGIITFYQTMPTFYAPELRSIFARLVAGQTPLTIHCSSGKDRSGFTTAMILSALGVSRPTVIADYALSADLIAAGAHHRATPVPSDIEKVTLASDPAYIESALDRIKVHYGSIETYLEKELDIGPHELNRLRTLYLE